MSPAVAILYPGEMGSAVGRAFVRHGWHVLTYVEGRSVRTRSAADDTGMSVAASLREMLPAVDVILSLVPPKAALETAAAVAAAAAAAKGRRFFVDANSIAPATVSQVCDVVVGAGFECVDGAFVGSAAALDTQTTLYLSGPRADDVTALFGDALRTRVVGPDIGAASAFKLAFAGFNKGLVALFLETAMAADLCSCRNELLARLREFYPGTVETAERLLPSYPRHAARRAEEMAELVEWTRAAGRRASMAEAARDVLTRFAALDLDDREWTAAEVLDICAEMRFLGEHGTM